MLETQARGSNRDPIIVLGMARSGTSLLANLIHRWGAYGGDLELLERRDIGNPKGYFENRQMAQFMLKQLGLDFWAPSYAERLRERAGDPECRRLAEELIAGMTVKGSPWFWKEPYLSVTLPFWKEVWSNAVYVIPIRDPYDSAVSWQKLSIPRELQDLVSIVHTTLLEWHHFMLRILEETDDTSRKLFISYKELVECPYEQCVRLAGFLEHHY